MRLNFCTLFNIGYLAKGLALYESLSKTCPEFHLYIFAFDELSYQVLKGRQLNNATIIGLEKFEDEALLEVKKTRSIAEYCWTCTPHTVKYCINNFALDHCTYVDADIYFYHNPAKLITEMADNSVLITPHNYHPLYDLSAVSGIYCVQFVCFKNTDDGLTVLNWWANACLKWCYSRYEDGKLGDQKYLDSWPYMFNGVHICRHPGAGMAPWNSLSFDLKKNGAVFEINNEPLYFYHFHALNALSNNTWFLGGYDIPNNIIENIYKPYIKQLVEIDKKTRSSSQVTDTLNMRDIKTVDAITLKFKAGLYLMDIKKSFRKFSSDLFFTGRKKLYKNNYIKLN